MSDTPICDALSLELVFKDHAAQLADECEMPSSVLAGPSSAGAFRAVIRVGGRRAGRSAERAEWLRWINSGSVTPIYDQMRREQFNESMRETVAKVQAVVDNQNRAMAQFVNGLRPYMQALADEEKRRQELLTYVYDLLNPAPTRGYKTQFAALNEMDPRARALSQTNKHYPTSSPSWARRSRR